MRINVNPLKSIYPLIFVGVLFVFVFRCLPLDAVVYRMNKHKLNTPGS